ncbi:MAG: AIPR family protein [Bacteroidaceae bacterium]|nr:AIPR family protein [Bacteroidaceae bacterium]
MDLKEFAQDFLENVNLAVEDGTTTRVEELTTGFLEYIEDTGEINAPELCIINKRGVGLNAYDYNEETDSLDFFILIEPDTELGKVSNSKVDAAFNKLMGLYREAKDGSLIQGLDNPNDELSEIVDLVRSAEDILTLRLFVLTTGLTEYSPTTIEMDNGVIMEQNVWDMQRIYQQDRLRAGKEQIEIDFSTEYDTDLQCLKMFNGNSNIDCYLAIIPGITLARIYKKYHQTLLEKNVRTFLQFKGAVNKGIRDTLRNNPSMFFSYNNGISTTASEVVTKMVDGQMYLTHIMNWQIVNGGQTTAAIASVYSDRGVDLSEVFVPMKISVIKDEAKSNEIIPLISTYANSQTAVKKSDFSSNDEFLVALENFSRSEWVPNGNSKSELKWYFERTRGQYLDELSLLHGQPEKMFKKNYPKRNKLTKTDIAKFEMAWEQKPEIVSLGAEKNYLQYVKLIKNVRPVVTSAYYKRLIAKGILYRSIDNIVKRQNLGGYKANMDCYLLSCISAKSKKSLDLDYIWEHQQIQPELEEVILNLIPLVWSHLTGAGTGNQTANVSEWSKKLECWNSLKVKLFNTGDIPANIQLSSEEMLDETLTASQLDLINKAWDYSQNTWFELANWAKKNNVLSPLERRMAYGYGVTKSRNKTFSFKQAQTALKMLEKAQGLGFELS